MRILEGKKEFHKMIRHAQNIFIVGHQDLDLDALGCALGMYEMLKNKNKHCYLVTNDKKNELGVEKVLAEVRNQLNIISTSQIAEYFHPISRKNLLLILDTNKKNLLPDETLDEQFDHVIVIDHHDESDNSVTKGLIIIDPDASSTCEMVTELIDSTRAILDPIVSTTLLAGIVLDTNNFILKTTAKTYYTAYNLTRLGADPKKVQYLLKQ